jgi:hypothetical protein
VSKHPDKKIGTLEVNLERKFQSAQSQRDHDSRLCGDYYIEPAPAKRRRA